MAGRSRWIGVTRFFKRGSTGTNSQTMQVTLEEPFGPFHQSWTMDRGRRKNHLRSTKKVWEQMGRNCEIITWSDRKFLLTPSSFFWAAMTIGKNIFLGFVQPTISNRSQDLPQLSHQIKHNCIVPSLSQFAVAFFSFVLIYVSFSFFFHRTMPSKIIGIAHHEETCDVSQKK